MDITWIPKNLLDTSGHMGLTRMPGSKQARDRDLDELLNDGIQQIFCLQQPKEFQQISPPETVEERRKAIELRHMKFIHEPMGDFTAPTLQQADFLVNQINQGLANGDNLVIHCFAGLGRAGTIAACVLTHHGYSAEEAVDLIRSHRQGAIQTQEQYDFVMNFESQSS